MISVDTIHKYVASVVALKTMIHMLSDDLDKGAQAVYQDGMEAIVCFHKDVMLKYRDTIIDY